MRGASSLASPDGQAWRINIDTNTRDDMGFFGPEGRRLFGCVHSPLNGPPLTGVVICPPTLVDFDRNYRREFALAGSLALRGFAVQRFHYRGTGNSEDSSDETTLQTMVEDALTAAQHLRQIAGVNRLGFVGTRVGAFIAAAASHRHGQAPLALWQPVIDPSAYFRDAMRSRLMRDLKLEAMRSGPPSDPKRTPKTRLSMSTLEETLSRTGLVDIIGHPLSRSFYESMLHRNLAEEIGAPRPVQILQVSLDNKLRGEYASLAEHLKAVGCSVDARIIADKEEAWWFADGRGPADESRPGTQALVAATTAWLLKHLPGDDVALAREPV